MVGEKQFEHGSFNPLLEHLDQIDLAGIHWVIVGGESGPKARPMKPEWVESIKEQCEEHGVAFFFKQWGGWGADGKNVPKKITGEFSLVKPGIKCLLRFEI